MGSFFISTAQGIINLKKNKTSNYFYYLNELFFLTKHQLLLLKWNLLYLNKHLKKINLLKIFILLWKSIYLINL